MTSSAVRKIAHAMRWKGAQHAAGMSRRSFIGWGAVAALGAAGLASCSPAPKTQADADPKDASTQDGTASTNAQAASAPATAQAASGNPAWLGDAPQIADADIKEEWDCDLLIVGAGNAGMTAAVKAAELGLDFRLIDKQATPSTPRNAIGAINDALAKAQDVTEDPARILHELVRYSSGKCNSSVVNVWVNQSAEMFDWAAGIMNSYGFDAMITADRGLDDPVYYHPATEHRFAARPDSDFADKNRHDVFLDYIQQKGYDLDGGCALVELTQGSDGAVTGAIAQRDGGYVRISAKNVLLCTGGYADNPVMMEALAPAASQTIAAWMLYPGNDGQGIKAALWAGAGKDIESTPMLFDRGAIAPGTDPGVVKDGDTYSVPMGYITTKDEYNPGTQPFLKVNRRGERFANEDGPYTDIVWAAQNQPGHTWCQIFDADFADDWDQFHTLGCSSLVRLRKDAFVEMVENYVEQGIIVKADTIEELAEKMGLDAQAQKTFLATVDHYNDLYDAGEDADFGKMPQRLSDIRKAPFYAAWLGTTLLTTEDGIKINADCQALNAQGEPIGGLYVAGDCAGSFFANNYPYLLPGVACGHCMVQGWKAVQVIAGV